MPELPPDLLPGQGEWLDDAYTGDFRARNSAIRNGNSWKLERLQHFEEPGNPSWEALGQGDWDEALRLMEDRADSLRKAAEDADRRGSRFHRVRIVEEPLTPYLQWELHSLHQRAQCGHRIRVLPAEALAVAEVRGPLPEIVVLDDRTLYRVVYDASGAFEGALRYSDPSIVRSWAEFIAAAYEAAEDIQSYFDRAVAHLPPPPAA
ncbi:DUF6879 family protein [Streptomyces sp. NPDC020917]|uniref:DUF6879 family protein n=1 Tax=Streptomyces sp. NPDC020917 TaxID=3365102 RepID=UPI0037A241DA